MFLKLYQVPYYSLLYDGTRKLTSPFMMLIIMVEKNAPQKPILTSGSIQNVKATMAMFSKMVKMPMDKMIRGRAKVVARGLTMELTSEKIRPAAM